MIVTGGMHLVYVVPYTTLTYFSLNGLFVSIDILAKKKQNRSLLTAYDDV